MKWLAVLLVLANVASYFWIQRQESTHLDLDPNRFEGINLERMTVKLEALDPTESSEVEEDAITRIDLTQEPASAKPTELVSNEGDDAEPQSDEVLEPKREPLPVVEVAAEIEAVKVPEPVIAAVEEEQDKVELEDKPLMASIDEEAAADIVETPEPEPQVVARLCYRVGPYTAQGALDNAVSVISNQNIEFAVTETSSEKQIKAARVYLGPFSSDDAMQSMRARLKEKRVDHYVINIEGKPRLQLGYFSGLSRGQNYQKRLVKVGFDAKLDKIYKDKLTDAWINFELQNADQLSSLDELKFYRVASIEKRKCS